MNSDNPEKIRNLMSVSRIITSDDVFNHIIDVRMKNENLSFKRNLIFEEKTRMNSMGGNWDNNAPRSIDMEDPESIRAYSDYNAMSRMSASQFVRKRVGIEQRTYSNGENGFKYFTDAIKKRCTTFLISDFIDEVDYSKALMVAQNRHDLIGIQIYDKRDANLPNVGYFCAQDLETGIERWIDTSSKQVRQTYDRWWYERQQYFNNVFNRNNIDYVSIATDEDYVKALVGLFKKRGIR